MTRVAYTRLRLPLAKIGKIKSRVLLGPVWIYKTAAWKDWEASAFKKALLVTRKVGKQRVLLELALLSTIGQRKRKTGLVTSPC
jgi:hypothetical protein